MNTDITLSPNSFEQRLLRVERGLRFFGLTILILSGVPNLVLASSISTYVGALPAIAHLLSHEDLSYFVFAYPAYCIGIAALLPLIGAFITWRARDPFRALVAASIYLLLIVVQFSLTWYSIVNVLRVAVRLLQTA